MRFILVSAVLFLIPNAIVLAADSLADQVDRKIKQLDASHPETVRIKALKWLMKHNGEPAVLKAIPYVKRLTTDPSPAIRADVIQVRVLLESKQTNICPLDLLKRLQDSDANVRSMAASCVGIFEIMPEESRSLLLKLMKHPDERVRANIPGMLFQLKHRDEEMFQAIKAATQDENLTVRFLAVTALVQLKQDWEFSISRLVQFALNVKLIPEGTENEGQEEINSIGYTALFLLDHLGKEQPDKLVPALLKLVKSDSIKIRHQAMRSLGGIAHNATSTKTAKVFDSLKVRQQLEPFLDDPDSEDFEIAAVVIHYIDTKLKRPLRAPVPIP